MGEGNSAANQPFTPENDVHYVWGGGGGVNGLCRAVRKCTYQIKATHGSE